MADKMVKPPRVTKTLVQKECGVVRAQLKDYCNAKISREIEQLAGILHGTFTDLEGRLARIEELLSSIESGL